MGKVCAWMTFIQTENRIYSIEKLMTGDPKLQLNGSNGEWTNSDDLASKDSIPPARRAKIEEFKMKGKQKRLLQNKKSPVGHIHEEKKKKKKSTELCATFLKTRECPGDCLRSHDIPVCREFQATGYCARRNREGTGKCWFEHPEEFEAVEDGEEDTLSEITPSAEPIIDDTPDDFDAETIMTDSGPRLSYGALITKIQNIKKIQSDWIVGKSCLLSTFYGSRRSDGSDGRYFANTARQTDGMLCVAEKSTHFERIQFFQRVFSEPLYLPGCETARRFENRSYRPVGSFKECSDVNFNWYDDLVVEAIVPSVQHNYYIPDDEDMGLAYIDDTIFDSFIVETGENIIVRDSITLAIAEMLLQNTSSEMFENRFVDILDHALVDGERYRDIESYRVYNCTREVPTRGPDPTNEWDEQAKKNSFALAELARRLEVEEVTLYWDSAPPSKPYNYAMILYIIMCIVCIAIVIYLNVGSKPFIESERIPTNTTPVEHENRRELRLMWSVVIITWLVVVYIFGMMDTRFLTYFRGLVRYCLNNLLKSCCEPMTTFSYADLTELEDGTVGAHFAYSERGLKYSDGHIAWHDELVRPIIQTFSRATDVRRIRTRLRPIPWTPCVSSEHAMYRAGMRYYRKGLVYKNIIQMFSPNLHKYNISQFTHQRIQADVGQVLNNFIQPNNPLTPTFIYDQTIVDQTVVAICNSIMLKHKSRALTIDEVPLN